MGGYLFVFGKSVLEYPGFWGTIWVDICTGDTFWREEFVSFWITIGRKWFWHLIGKFS